MTKDAKAAEKQRLADALRANLRRRKAAQGKTADCARAGTEKAAETKDGAREARADGTS